MPGPIFKCLVPKLLILINIKIVPYIKETDHVFDISLDMYILLSNITTVDHLFTVYLSHSLSCLPAWCTYASVCQWVEIYTFINMLVSNHTIEIVNTSNSTCHSTLNRWKIGNNFSGLNRCWTCLNIRSNGIN